MNYVRRNLTTSAANEMYKSERHFGLDNEPYEADEWARSIDAAITRPMVFEPKPRLSWWKRLFK